jgi:hypothetical protein
LKANDPHEPSDLLRRSGENTAGDHPPQSAQTPLKSTGPLERGQWLEIIKAVKSSDRSEIAQAYEAAMPYVVADWANWLLSKPRAARLPLIEKIAKHHGDEVGEMVKRKLTELHRDSSRNFSCLQSPTSRSK